MGLARVVFAMSRDGLLPRWLSKTTKRTTPVRLQIIGGTAVAVVAGLHRRSSMLEEMINIGTLSAFVIVSIGISCCARSAPTSALLPGAVVAVSPDPVGRALPVADAQPRAHLDALRVWLSSASRSTSPTAAATRAWALAEKAAVEGAFMTRVHRAAGLIGNAAGATSAAHRIGYVRATCHARRQARRRPRNGRCDAARRRPGWHDRLLPGRRPTLRAASANRHTVTLGRPAPPPSSILEHSPALAHAPSGSAGLFHTAILFDTQAALAASLYSVARHAPGTFTGSADHLVSQAFYFTDPEGNGVELYWDRDRSDWSWVHGQVEMDDPLPRPQPVPRRPPHRRGSRRPASALSAARASANPPLRWGMSTTARELLRRHARLRPTAAVGNPAALRCRRAAPPPHGHERLELAPEPGRACPHSASAAYDIVVPDGRRARRPGRAPRRTTASSVQDDGTHVELDDPWNNRLFVARRAPRRGVSGAFPLHIRSSARPRPPSV